MKITELIKQKIIICDGAMGTMLQSMGAPMGRHPELLSITHPELLEDIYGQYFAAGSDFVSTNTFGANRWKLQGCGFTTEQVVEKGVEAARRAADKAEAADGRQRYVALDVSPIGRLMEPVGDLSFDEAWDIYTEQISAGYKAGADFVLFETYTDIYELKAGVLAAKECCDLPVFCSVTFQEDGRMLMGTDPATMVNILQDMGIDVLGVNCSLGPKQMVPIVKEILAESRLPVLVQPNAGLPRMENGKTVFDVDMAEYTEAMEELAEAGIAVAGGCCGTTPAYIEAMSKSLAKKKPGWPRLLAEKPPAVMTACSATKTVRFDKEIVIIGERINPTGKKALKAALKEGDFTYVENEAIRQAEGGAHILDVNVGLPGIHEKTAMLEAVRRISLVTDLPLQIDSADAQVLEAAVRRYNGKPIINSVNGKKSVMDAVFPIAQKYGASVVALTLDEKGLPADKAQRMEIAERIIHAAAEYGIGPERILVDCLTLTVSAEPMAALDTLSAITELKKRYPVKTTLGASNVSFGLPNRRLLNASFLTAALYAGLDAPITDPLMPEYMDAVRAYSALFGRDPGAERYIDKYKDCPAPPPVSPGASSASATAAVFEGAAVFETGCASISEAADGAEPGAAAGQAQARGHAGGNAVSSPCGAAASLSGSAKAAQAAGSVAEAGAGSVPASEYTAGVGSGSAPKALEAASVDAAASPDDPARRLSEIITRGYEDRAAACASRLLETRTPLAIVEDIIIPALGAVGRDYETGRSFLPQLIRSADTVRAAFEVLKAAMASDGEEICYGRIILATVEGDIHDIGKNIVKVLLENYGYQVIDMGKDVPVEAVVEAARRESIRMVGLSALMTTTVVNMERTIRALREAGLACKIAVGGAVLTEEYAREIGADFYCKEAMDTIRAANGLFRDERESQG